MDVKRKNKLLGWIVSFLLAMNAIFAGMWFLEMGPFKKMDPGQSDSPGFNTSREHVMSQSRDQGTQTAMPAVAQEGSSRPGVRERYPLGMNFMKQIGLHIESHCIIISICVPFSK